MKFIFFMAGVLCHASSAAAQIDTATFKGKVDNAFQLLDKTRLVTGIFYDRVEPVSGLREFGHRGQVDTSFGGHFFQAVEDLAHADYAETPEKLSLATDLTHRTRQKNRVGVLPIGALRYRFDVFDTNSIANGTLILGNDGLLRQNPDGPFSSVFLQHSTFVADILGVDLYPGSYRLVADPYFWLTNMGESLSYYLVFFQDALQGRVAIGDSLTLNFPSAGSYAYRIEAHTASGQVYSCYSVLQVNAISADEDPEDKDPYWAQNFPPSCDIRSYPIEASIPFAGYEPGDVPLLGKAEYSIYKRYNDQNNCGMSTIIKPIIILDGFDPLDDRKAECLYGKYLRYTELPSSKNYLGDIVRSADNQYDVIILNFKDWHKPNGDLVRGGADYVERNAMVLVELINQVNAALAANGSNEKLVIIGPSMGGLISRYALAYMEKHSMDHRCRLWISFDSPHQGANISIGAQQFLKFWGKNGVTEAQFSVDNLLGSTAAKQMLVHHVLNDIPWGQNHGAPGYRSRFVTALTSNGLPGSFGFPKNLRKVALINGSINGTSFGPNCIMATKMEVYVKFKSWSLIDWLYRMVFRPARVAYSKTYMSPSNSNCTVYSGYKMGGDPDETEIDFKDLSINGLGYDSGPGGSFPIFGTIGSASGPTYQPIPLYDFGPVLNSICQSIVPNKWKPYVNIPKFGEVNLTLGGYSFGLGTRIFFFNFLNSSSFIPTKSALAYHYGDFVYHMTGNLAEDLSARNLLCTSEIPFDNYFAPTVNQTHVQTTKENVDWVLAELKGTPIYNHLPKPTNIEIRGPKAICPGTSGEFHVNLDNPAAYTYKWEIPTGCALIGSSTSQYSTIEVDPGNTAHSLTVSCTVKQGTGCQFTYSYTFIADSDIEEIEVKCGNAPFGTDLGVFLCKGITPNSQTDARYLYLDIPSLPLYGPTITWSPITDNNNNAPVFPPYTGFGAQRYTQVYPNHANPLMFNVKIETACGVKEKDIVMNYTFFNSSSDPCLKCSDAQWLVISPNPAVKGVDTEVMVLGSNTLPLPASGKIVDERGQVLHRFEMPQNPVNVSIARLDMAEYKVVLESGAYSEEATFTIGKSVNDKMVISPNPVFKEVDQQVKVKILGNTEDNDFDVAVTDVSGTTVQTFSVSGKTFPMDVSQLPIGGYMVTGTGQNSVFQEVLELTMKGKPNYSVNPNPAISQITSDVENALNPESQWTITIRDKMGVVVREEQNQIPPFQTNLDGLPADLYYIQISNQSEVYYKILRKN